ncbi:MAG TPA: protein-L-isoaspartate(D-aspartate) O-methyltransferase [Spirochaetota bacterium]|nr:protein-L-isoaspartate(D-aspartate) O-methyltransferase [Spirochaetota bacterium]
MYHNSDSMYRPRLAMVEKLQQKGITSGSVLEAMLNVPRHMFVSDALCYRAYDDTSLPIGFGQTISTPSVVASMVQSLKLTGDEKVLEIGSGSGYQAAVLSELSENVTAMERIPELAERSRAVLGSLGCNVKILTGDDFNDIESVFDRIIVAAGVTVMPYDLLEKLEPGGILVIPVNENGRGHRIKRFVRKKDNDFFEEVIGMATFVPYITAERPV